VAGHPTERLSRAQDYYSGLRDAADLAAERAGGWVDHDLEIAGGAVRIRFAGPALVGALLPPLEHLAIGVAAAPPAIAVVDSLSTETPRPPVPWSRESIDPRGRVAEDLGDGIVAYHNPHFGGVTLFDPESGDAVYWVESAARIPWYERGSPLRTALQLVLTGDGRSFVHAGAVGSASAGVLVGGRSGSGKSTLVLACVESGLGYAGDDYVVVTLDPLRAHALYTTAKVDPAGVPRLGRLAANVDHGASDVDKTVLDLRGAAEILDAVPVVGVVVPRVKADGPSELSPIGPAEAFRLLSPSTAIQMPHGSAEALAATAALLAEVPSYRLELGADPAEAAGLVRGLVGAA
jgi:hypothetical protein